MARVWGFRKVRIIRVHKYDYTIVLTYILSYIVYPMINNWKMETSGAQLRHIERVFFAPLGLIIPHTLKGEGGRERKVMFKGNFKGKQSGT